MALDPDFLSILRCPLSSQRLREATAEELQSVNARVSTGSVRNRGGEQVREALDQGLVPESGDTVYPVREGIPVLLVDSAIPLADDEEIGSASTADITDDESE